MLPVIDNRPNQAKIKLALMTRQQLINAWNATTGQHGQDIATVRDWLLSEFQVRNPQAFEAWLESCEDSPAAFFSA